MRETTVLPLPGTGVIPVLAVPVRGINVNGRCNGAIVSELSREPRASLSPAYTAHPSWIFASSDIIAGSHGGSHTRST